MATFNLHVIGHAVEVELEQLVQEFVAKLEGSHTVESATLTTDAGQRDVPLTPPEPEPTPPVLAPVDTPPNAVPEGDTNPPDEVAVSEETPQGESSTAEGGGDT